MGDRNSSSDFVDTTSSVRLFQSETVLMKKLFLYVSVCTAQKEAAAVVSGEPPDGVAGGEVRSAGSLNLPLVLHRCQKGFCWNGWDETCGNFLEAAQAVKPPGLKGLTKLGTGVGCMLESPYLSVCPSVCISEFVQKM